MNNPQQFFMQLKDRFLYETFIVPGEIGTYEEVKLFYSQPFFPNFYKRETLQWHPTYLRVFHNRVMNLSPLRFVEALKPNVNLLAIRQTLVEKGLRRDRHIQL